MVNWTGNVPGGGYGGNMQGFAAQGGQPTAQGAQTFAGQSALSGQGFSGQGMGQGGAGSAPMRTLAGVASDRGLWRDKFDFGQATGSFGNGQQTLEARQANLGNLWKVAEATGTIPDEISAMYGLPKGTRTMDAQKFGLDKQKVEADIANMNADNTRLDNPPGGSGGANGMNVNSVVDNLRGLYSESSIDPQTGQQVTRFTTDAAKIEDAYMRIAGLGLPYEQENQAMLMLGLSQSKIAELDKKHGFSSGN